MWARECELSWARQKNNLWAKISAAVLCICTFVYCNGITRTIFSDYLCTSVCFYQFVLFFVFVCVIQEDKKSKSGRSVNEDRGDDSGDRKKGMFFSWSRNRSFGKGPKKRELTDFNYSQSFSFFSIEFLQIKSFQEGKHISRKCQLPYSYFFIIKVTENWLCADPKKLFAFDILKNLLN